MKRTLGYVVLLLLAGCVATPRVLVPVTFGVHVPNRVDGPRVVVWADDAAIASTLTTAALARGLTVVERARLQAVFEEMAVHLTHTDDDASHVLRVGKLLGATPVIFAEHAMTPDGTVRVMIRAVEVETGAVVFRASSQFREPVNNPDAWLSYLTQQALHTVWGSH